MTVGVVLPDAPPRLVDRRLFAVHDIEFTVADVVRLARPGDRECAAPSATPAGVQEAFRRARGLLTADKLTSWLADWSITPDEFVEWSHAPQADTWAGFVCSGALEHAASQAAAAAAAACELDAVPLSAATFDPADWVAQLGARAVTSSAVEVAIRAHRLAWTHVSGAGVFARSRGVAEELRHWVVEDALDLAVAAAQAGCPTYVVDGVLDDLEPAQLRAAVSGLRPGELVGPLAVGPGWTVLRLDSRAEPDPSDPATVARAGATVRSEVLERAVLRHVST